MEASGGRSRLRPTRIYQAQTLHSGAFLGIFTYHPSPQSPAKEAGTEVRVLEPETLTQGLLLHLPAA